MEEYCQRFFSGHLVLPVYMTVIDRESNVHYRDVKLGTVPLTEHGRYRSEYYGWLYDSGKGWFILDLDRWAAQHREKTD